MSMKRTRPIKKYWHTVPRVAISEPCPNCGTITGGIYVLKEKVSQVTVEKVKELPERKNDDM